MEMAIVNMNLGMTQLAASTSILAKAMDQEKMTAATLIQDLLPAAGFVRPGGMDIRV